MCQEVCPFDERRATPTSQPRNARRAPLVTDFARVTEEEFLKAFYHSPVPDEPELAATLEKLSGSCE